MSARVMNNNFMNFFNENLKESMNPENFAKQMKEFQGFDLSKVSEVAKKNAEVFSEAAQVAAESAQSLVRRGVEIVQNNASNIFNTMKEVASSANPEQAVARQQQFAQSFVKETVNNTKEMLDMASKSAMEVFDRVSQHNCNHMSSCSMENSEHKKSKK